jgi:hypothetical protein
MMWYGTYLLKQALHGPWNVKPAKLRRHGTMEEGSQRSPTSVTESDQQGSKPTGYPQTGSVSGGTGGSTYA